MLEFRDGGKLIFVVHLFTRVLNHPFVADIMKSCGEFSYSATIKSPRNEAPLFGWNRAIGNDREHLDVELPLLPELPKVLPEVLPELPEEVFVDHNRQVPLS